MNYVYSTVATNYVANENIRRATDGGTMNVSLLTCLAARNFLLVGAGADRANRGWLSSTVCEVGTKGDDGGNSVPIVIDRETISLLSYWKWKSKTPLAFLCDGPFERFALSCMFSSHFHLSWRMTGVHGCFHTITDRTLPHIFNHVLIGVRGPGRVWR